MQPGVEVEVSKAQKDELILFGNSLEGVSQSAADIQQICKVRNKDIRKVGTPRVRGAASCSSGTMRAGFCDSRFTDLPPIVPRRCLRFREGQHYRGVRETRSFGFFVLYGSHRSVKGSGICIFCSVKKSSLRAQWATFSTEPPFDIPIHAAHPPRSELRGGARACICVLPRAQETQLHECMRIPQPNTASTICD